MVNAIRRIGILLALVIGGASTVLAQQAATPETKYSTWWLPDRSATVAGPIDDLFYMILWITSAVFAIVFVAMIVFMIKFRYREGRRAVYTHGNNKLEIAWTVIPALILVFLGVISQSVWSDIKQAVPGADTTMVIEVRPRQFQWDIRYAGADGAFDTPDDITTINQLHVPVNKTVLLNMSAQDVIHSFFVPEFRMKQDAVPGMITRYWFTATHEGAFEIACAELCGLGHYRMRGFLTVHSPTAFDEWYAGEVARKAAQLAPAAAAGADSASAISPAPATPADTVAAGSAPADTTTAADPAADS